MHRLLIIFLSIAPLLVHAQERARPQQTEELWASFTLSGRPPKFFNDIIGKETRKRFRLSTEMGYRTNDNFFGGRQFYADGNIRFEITDSLSIGVEHRYSYRPNDADRQRTGVLIYATRNFGKFEVDYRGAYQHSYKVVQDADMLRNRLTVEYNIPKWKFDPVGGAELFTWISPFGLDNTGIRYRAGTKYSPWKGHEFTLYMVHDRERNVAWPDHRWILSIDYSLNVRKL